jgi:signal transduction histidine kinase/CheY-like chemotaxis protein
MNLMTQLRVVIAESKQLFDVDPFERSIEQLFQNRQVKIGCLLMGLVSFITFVAFSMHFIIFFLNPESPRSELLSRFVTTTTSLYFAFVAYRLLLSKGNIESRTKTSTRFAFVLGFALPFSDLFRPIHQGSYDLLPIVIVFLAMSGISRFSHKKGFVWLAVIFTSYLLGKWYLFGIMGPDAAKIAVDRDLIRDQFSVVQLVQIFQAAALSYLIFRANEARERVIFLREQELAKAAEDRLHLLHGIGHDLRQPMTALMLHSEFARKCANVNDFDKMNESLRLIDDNLHLMNTELIQVTELAASHDPSAVVKLEPLNILAIVVGIAAAFRPRAVASSIELVIVPRTSSSYAFVSSDELLIRRCLSNLVSNAFKFTEVVESKASKSIKIEAEIFDKYAALSVLDSGIGIAPENIEKIWEPFFQIGNPARKSEMGFGLGLAHVRAAIDRMPGHSISVSSKLGEGTKFTILLPLADESILAESPVAPLENTSNEKYPSFDGSLIFLVEDDALLRSSLSRGFESWGARVAEAESVESAKKLIDSLEVPPDFVIVDFRLPDGDARDVFSYIDSSPLHGEGNRCHWVCLTGEHTTNLKKLEGLPISIIRKPVNLATLRARLNEIASIDGRV